MKKYIICIFIIFFLSVPSLFAQWISLDGTNKVNKPNIKVLNSDYSSLLIEISLPGIEITKRTEDSQTFDELRFPEYYTTLEVGKPQLPVIRELLGVPDFSDYKFSIIDSSVILLTNYNIFPFQEPVFEGEKEAFIIDESFYQHDDIYPANIVELDMHGIWRDIKVSRLSIFPVRYIPKTKTLKIYKRVVIKIDIKDVSGSVFIRKKHIPKEWEKLYKKSIINYDFLPQSFNKNNSINSVVDYDYLIITANDYLDAIQPLAQWKTRSGLLSKVVSVNEIGNNETSIKNYITNEYNAHNIRYVLLVGDISQLCWSSIPSSVPGNPPLPGDYNYSLHAGGDFLPEVAIGRISAISVAEVQHIINKGIKYETIPPVDNWVRNTLLVAHKEGAPGKYQGCKEEIRTYDYFHNPIFSTAYGASSAYSGDEATNVDVNSYINSGMGIVNYRGHGSPIAWTMWNINNESYTTSNVRALNNGNKNPIVFSIACSNAKLDYNGECLAEAFSKADYGTTAILGATRPSYTSANHTYDEQLFITAFDLENMNIGYTSNAAAERIITWHGITGEDNAKMYLWLGDPSIELWTNSLQQYTNVQITDNGSSITVNCGVYGSTICASSGNNGSSYYNRQDNRYSYTFHTSVRPLYITITKHNYIPYTAVTGGNFTSDETWFGNLHLLGTVTVSGNGSLTLLPNTHVLMDGYYTIATYDNACLIAEGTEEDPILFTSTSGTTPQSWNRLYLRTDNNSLKWCEIEYSNWGIHAIGYPSSGNVFENCNLHDNDIGFSIEQNTCDMINCHVYDNRHNIVAVTNPQVNISGTHITDGGRDGIYSSTGNLLNIYGCVIENNGTGGTSTRNGIRTGSGNVINIGRLNYPTWNGYNTIRNNYESEIYATSGLSGLQVYYSSIHDNNGYEVYNASVNNPYIYTMECWWGEYPPNGAQFYGNVYIIDPLLSQPAWEGQTFSGQQFSKSGFMPVSAPSPWEKIASLKLIIDEKSGIEKADSALVELFNIIRTDFVTDRYKECDGFYQYLSGLYDSNDKNALGKRALQYMILWKTLEGSFIEAISLSENALISFDSEDLQQVTANLVLLYSYSAQFTKADDILSHYKDKYKNDLPEIEFLERTLADYKVMFSEEQRLSKDGILPDSEPKDPLLPEEYTLQHNYPNPFNPITSLCFGLPERTHVTLTIYDITGRLVEQLINQHIPAGYHTISWDATSYSSGVYIARLKAGRSIKTQKMVLMK